MQLAFSADDGETRMGRRMMAAAWIVFRKELIDALRDRRTLLMVLLSARWPSARWCWCAVGAGGRHREARRGARGGRAGIEHAPTLRNYLERQTYTVRAAPADYEQQLQRQQARRPGAGGPARTSRPSWRAARRRWWSCVASARQPARAGRQRRACCALLRGFNQEQATLRLARARRVRRRRWRPCEIEERDLADPASARRAADRHGAVLRADGGALRRAQCGAGHDGRRARARLAGAAADEPGAARWRWCWASGARWPASAC